MANDREVLKIVVVGHVDHGKSTVIGRLLYDTKSVPEGKIERVKQISRDKGKPFEYAYLLDAFEEEQKQGITIDITQLQFFTAKREYVIIDAPGHKEFLKNMISGAANAEAALLVIDAREGVQEQSKRHGYILSLLGIRKVYVVINKMDLIDYSEEKFNEIRHEMNRFLNSLHVYPLRYIPVSAFYGENMTHRSPRMEWYQGESILESLDLFAKEKGREDKELRFPIQDVYKFDDRRIIAGRIESGTLKVGDEILISPGHKTTRVKSIESWLERDKKETVSAGMSVGITVADEFFNKRGEVITHLQHPPLVSDTFKANIFWMGRSPLLKNKKYKLKLVTQEQECEIITISKVIDAITLDTTENAAEVKTNDVAEVSIRTKEKVSLDEFKNNAHTGRFVLLDGYDVSGGGIVSGLDKGQQTASKFTYHNSEIRVTCFDEYYYFLGEGTVRQVPGKPDIFGYGDVIPVLGETYLYPADFDLIDLQSRLAARIRRSRLEEIVGFDNYAYSALPVLDPTGAYVKIDSQAAWEQLLEEYQAIRNGINKWAAFANRWKDFMRFRRIKFDDAHRPAEVDYSI